MKWPTEGLEREFRALYPQYPNACAHAAMQILLDTVHAYRQQDREMRERLDRAIPDWIHQVQRHHHEISTFGT